MVVEDCVRLAVIKDALELHSRGDSKLIALQKDKKYAPVSESETRKADSQSVSTIDSLISTQIS